MTEANETPATEVVAIHTWIEDIDKSANTNSIYFAGIPFNINLDCVPEGWKVGDKIKIILRKEPS